MDSDNAMEAATQAALAAMPAVSDQVQPPENARAVLLGVAAGWRPPGTGASTELGATRAGGPRGTSCAAGGA